MEKVIAAAIVVGMLIYLWHIIAGDSRASSPSSPQTLHSTDLRENDAAGELDISTYNTEDIPKIGLFSASERRAEYRRRGKSPSGVIDDVYNDMYREDGHAYGDMDRDWDANAKFL